MHHPLGLCQQGSLGWMSFRGRESSSRVSTASALRAAGVCSLACQLCLACVAHSPGHDKLLLLLLLQVFAYPNRPQVKVFNNFCLSIPAGVLHVVVRGQMRDSRQRIQ
jgi:hypothetical protein